MENIYVKRIRDLREDLDKTQREIADVLGTSQTMYARYERGANELPIRHLIVLCKYYKVSADYLLGLSNKRRWARNRAGGGDRPADPSKEISPTGSRTTVREALVSHGLSHPIPITYPLTNNLVMDSAQMKSRQSFSDLLQSLVLAGSLCSGLWSRKRRLLIW